MDIRADTLTIDETQIKLLMGRRERVRREFYRRQRRQPRPEFCSKILCYLRFLLFKIFIRFQLLRMLFNVSSNFFKGSLPYSYWTPAEWHSAFDKSGLFVSSWESNLNLYSFPADLIFGRSLHFIAALRVARERGNSDGALQQLDR
jgi:hypothetical protein